MGMAIGLFKKHEAVQKVPYMVSWSVHPAPRVRVKPTGVK